MKKIVVLLLWSLSYSVSGMEIDTLQQTQHIATTEVHSLQDIYVPNFRDVHHEDFLTFSNNIIYLTEIYSQPDGFNQWKSDGEWLMSDEFFNDFLREGDNPKSKSVTLLNTWLHNTLGSGGFDGKWSEDLRDSAIPFIDQMLDFYEARVDSLPDGSIEDKMLEIIENLCSIEDYFGIIVDYTHGDVPLEIYKSTGDVCNRYTENGRVTICNIKDLINSQKERLSILPDCPVKHEILEIINRISASNLVSETLLRKDS